MVAWHRGCTKCHWIVHFQMVNSLWTWPELEKKKDHPFLKHTSGTLLDLIIQQLTLSTILWDKHSNFRFQDEEAEVECFAQGSLVEEQEFKLSLSDSNFQVWILIQVHKGMVSHHLDENPWSNLAQYEKKNVPVETWVLHPLLWRKNDLWGLPLRRTFYWNWSIK